MEQTTKRRSGIRGIRGIRGIPPPPSPKTGGGEGGSRARIGVGPPPNAPDTEVVGMSDPAEFADEQKEEIAGGVYVAFEPVGGGRMKLKATHNGDIISQGEFSGDIFTGSHKGRTERGEFLNNLEESVEQIDGLDAGSVKAKFRQWFAEMGELDKEEQAEYLLTDEVQAIIEGTHYPVRVHGGETTTVHVDLTYQGRTAELEFTASEMVKGGATALQEKIATKFFDFDLEIEQEDWKAIRERWDEQKEVVGVVEETAEEAVTDRVLTFLRRGMQVVADREKMANDVATCWFDENNETGYADAPADGPVLWVQSEYLADQLENAGKKLEYKPQLTKDLIASGDLHGSNKRAKWGVWSDLTRLYPFDPDAFGVTADDVRDSDDPAHSEVSA